MMGTNASMSFWKSCESSTNCKSSSKHDSLAALGVLACAERRLHEGHNPTPLRYGGASRRALPTPLRYGVLRKESEELTPFD